MKWRIEISKASQKFIKKNKIGDDEVITCVRQAIINYKERKQAST